ncbi:MAG: hypothetical protein JSW17_02335 [Candidatus Omnitrophota bacterium]|nr:MAG: hypothetical protein JSW17_02335 [Candidatus Omnitrophota bacterium]
MRRFVSLKALIFLFTLAVLPLAFSQPQKTLSSVEVSASVGKDKITIGEKFIYTLEVNAPQNIEIEFPDFDESLAGFSIKDERLLKRSFLGRKRELKRFILYTYVTGPYIIPAAVIKYKEKNVDQWQGLETNEVVVQVESVLEGEELAAGIKDIKGPVDFPSRLWIFVVILILVAVVLSVIVLGQFINRKRKAKAISFVPAHEAAYAALKALKGKDYLRRGKMKEYYSELSNIIRRYIEERFKIRAPEMTTEEFFLSIKDATFFSKEQVKLLKEFLSHCDMVKFAKHIPAQKEIDESFAAAERFIDQTKEERG